MNDVARAAMEDVASALLEDMEAIILIDRQRQQVGALLLSARGEGGEYADALDIARTQLDEARKSKIIDILTSSTWLFGFPVLDRKDARTLIRSNEDLAALHELIDGD